MKQVFLGCLLAALMLPGCSEDADRPQAASAPGSPAQAASTSAHGVAAGAAAATARDRPTFATLPDRGELADYPASLPASDKTVRRGAYTWHRIQISEAHALNAIAGRPLRITTPSGELLDFRYQRHVEHPSGDWTWIGQLEGGTPSDQAIVTFGAQAVFGSLAQRDDAPLRLAMRDGVSWLVETDRSLLAKVDNAATKPARPDYLLPPKPASWAPAAKAPGMDRGPASTGHAPATSAATAGVAGSTVDVLLGYTNGFAASVGGQSAAVTRLNNLVDTANVTLQNSQLAMRFRLVHAMQVNYTDNTDNQVALEEMTGFVAPSTQTTPKPAFNALRAAREQYGADLVSLARKFTYPENNGCGIAWLVGGAQTPITQEYEFFGYSVISDGQDGGYYCRDETLAHELAHNMGSAHDKQTAKGDDGTLDPDEYGRYAYSFGQKTAPGSGDFFTVMAYGDAGQVPYRIYSNPGTTFCGGRACGVANQADNARSLRQTLPVIATFRTAQTASTNRVLLKQLDTNGNGTSDLLFFNHALSRLSIWFMHGPTRLAYSSSTFNGAFRLVDAGDFDGNGRTDLLFDNPSAGILTMALSTGSSYTQHTLANGYSTGTFPIGVADVNGDGKADILLRNASTGRVTLWYMSGVTRIAYNGYNVPTSWEFVGRGDLNGDHKQDLLWTNVNRQLQLSTSIGVSFTTQILSLAYQSTYGVAGLQDVNGDSRADILLPSIDGTRLVVWYMNGPTRIAYNSHPIDPAYMLVGKGDFDGNHRGDLVMSNRATRQIKFLQSSGAAFSTSLVASIPQSGSVLMDVQ